MVMPAAGGAGQDLLGALDIDRVQVGHLLLGQLAQLLTADQATLLRFGAPEPLSTPAALRSRSAAGGVFSAIVNERSG